MKTIKEQIEILKAFDDGKDIVERGERIISTLNKASHPNYKFNFVDKFYEIHEEVKPLFPTFKQGAKYVVDIDGRIRHVNDFFNCGDYSEYFAKQGRTFYTPEDAEAFVRREQAKTYCLEAINRVNEGDNGFKDDKGNYILLYDMSVRSLDIHLEDDVRAQEANECIRTEEATQELINDAEFVENWKIWKGVA